MDPYSNRPMYPQQGPGVVPPGTYPPPGGVPPQGAYPPQGTYPPPGTVPPPTTMQTVPVTYPSNEPIISVNPGALFGGMQFVYVEDPMVELATCPSLLIRQEPEFFAAMTGCEQPNIYHVFGNTAMGFKYLFKCLERSNCFTRKYLPGSCRPFSLDIIHCNSMDQLGMGYTTPFATMVKPCTCTICCLCRPEIDVILNSTGQAIGKIKHVCTVCDPIFEVYNGAGLRFIVTGSCCQCAIIFPSTFGKCYRGEFDILEGGQPVGKITREIANMAEMNTDADTYVVNFPPTADANDKLLLIGLTMLLDYQYFETDADTEKKGEERARRSGGVKVKTGGKRRRK